MRTRFALVWVLFLSSTPWLFSHDSHSSSSAAVPAASGSTELRLEEEKVQFSMDLERLELSLINNSGQLKNAVLHLQLLDIDDKVLGSNDQAISIPPGNRTLNVPWPFKPPGTAQSDNYWWRLRYEITWPASDGPGKQKGILQFGAMATQWMRLQVVSVRYSSPGSSFPARVRVVDRRSGKGMAGVLVQATITDSDEPRPISAHAVKTDAQGYALLRLKLPADADSNSGFEIIAQHGAASISQTLDVRIQDERNLTLSTDKPIYQPGQTLHMRVLALTHNGHVAANESVAFSVEDEDGEAQFEQEATTSKFGIAAADWEIPSQLNTGHYRVAAKMGEQNWRSEVRISRYELPEFTVNPATDKKYYLPGQPVQLDVTASYLFSQPVKRGKVRIIRDGDRHWNSQTKQWDSDEKQLQQGELDGSGKFSTTVDLKSEFDELKGNDYERYRDVRLAAYVTDDSTRRTEQKRLTVRLSKDPIHIYAMNRPEKMGEALNMYLTAAYPDGTPAQVDLAISGIKPCADGTFPITSCPSDLLPIARIHTNEYGIAHLQTHALPQTLLVSQNYGSYAFSEGQLFIEAHDKHGQHAVHVEQIGLEDGAYFHIRPRKRILQAGESVTAEIESSAPDQAVFVDLLGQQKVLASQRVELHHGRAEVEFAYDPEFRNSLYLVAYNITPTDQQQTLSSGAEILFPEPQDLDLGVHLTRTTYKPGEAAVADFRVRSPDGKPIQSALGVLVYDKAVAERVRSDQEFGSYGFYFYDGDWRHQTTIDGIGYRDLLNQKLTQPVTPQMELVAEAILGASDNEQEWRMDLQSGDQRYELSSAQVFRKSIARKLDPVRSILEQYHANSFAYPVSAAEFHALMAKNQIDFAQIHDPWDRPYYLGFNIQERNAVLEILSSGPSKTPGTREEFVAESFAWPFFAPTGKIMDAAAAAYAKTSGKYIRDLSTLRAQLEARGINLNNLRDPWQQPYTFTFEVDGPLYRINVLSQGPPRTSGVKRRPLCVWQTSIHYFQKESQAMDRELAKHFGLTGKFPASQDELWPVLQATGITPESLRDPWGNPYHFEFSMTSRYANHMDISVYDEKHVGNLIPVTQQLAWIYVMSYGPHNDPTQKFELASFSQVVAEQNSRAEKPTQVSQAPLNGLSGAISGLVTDPVGAVIPNATVTATDELTGAAYTAKSDEGGVYLLRNLPAGRYQVMVDSPGFKSSMVRLVPVASSNVTKVDIRLSVGGATETVEVTAAAPRVESTSAMVVSAGFMAPGKTANSIVRIELLQQAFTPRLRKYFPETLLWRPELVTDSSGRAQLKFAMADNITSWKMSVVASNMEGQLGIAEKELRTFQPFFVDHDPPKILTQGDQIELPVVLRNYTEKSQDVQVKLEQAPWFSLLSAAQQRISVPAREDATAHFLVSAAHSVREGKERVAAANRDTGDAVEHTVAVHPDGQSVTHTVAQIASGKQVSLQMQVPANAIAGSVEAELKIFPNLASHVLDSVQGMVARPAGCGEQITSIAYGSLLTLQVLRKGGQDDPKQPGNPNSELAAQAHKYVNDAYRQLLTLQDTNGGFPYWLHQEPNLALTAYILDFLTQAAQFIDVDRNILTRARNFIVSSQDREGAWTRTYYTGKAAQDTNLTALVARSLAVSLNVVEEKPKSNQAIAKALDFLSARISEWKDPYLVGQYALAAAQSGRTQDLAKARKLLADLAHPEGSGVYWNLEANASPFYGWGFAGRIETTGLAVQALARITQGTHNADELTLVSRGLLYLLAHKDRYGVWYSTHASVNVLRAIIAAMPDGPESGAGGPAQIMVNGKAGAELRLPASSQISGPVRADISSLLTSGANEVTVVRDQDTSPLQLQVISTHYVAWAGSHASSFEPGESRALSLNVAFDQTHSQVGKSIQCDVSAERIGFYGYGMMLAEIGLPPGADVDRSSLEHAKDTFAISEYDVMPDRVVVYIWPRAGGSKFSFSFKPRFAMNAAAAPSVLYDYYNPEAQATVAPARFEVQ